LGIALEQQKVSRQAAVKPLKNRFTTIAEPVLNGGFTKMPERRIPQVVE
jgi:hypothetical protein